MTDSISDGYHTFSELYDHRRALTAALLAALTRTQHDLGAHPWAWRSKLHHPDDNPMFDGGYFIVGADLPTGQISYHYKLRHWDDFADIPERQHAPRWDGHTPDTTVDRLLRWARGLAATSDAGNG